MNKFYYTQIQRNMDASCTLASSLPPTNIGRVEITHTEQFVNAKGKNRLRLPNPWVPFVSLPLSKCPKF
jgi:hypothetical protein